MLAKFGYRGFTPKLAPFSVAEGGGLFRVDIAFPREKVAVELDGPGSFIEETDGSRRLSGPAEAKERVLRALGWKVVHYDWVLDEKWRGLNKAERQIKWRKILDKCVKPKGKGWITNPRTG